MNAHELSCAEFEAILSEYRDGLLGSEAAAAVRLHLGGCAGCAALLAMVNAAGLALRELPPAEPSAAWWTAVRAPAGKPPVASVRWLQRLGRRLLAPRFALSFAMSVFAVALVLDAADVNLGHVSWRALTPAGLTAGAQRDLDRLRARGMAYVEDLRVVYEIEAAVHQMRQAPPPPASHDHSQRSLMPSSAEALDAL